MIASVRRRVPAASAQVVDYAGWRCSSPLDAIVAFAFIHLFPTDQARRLLRKMWSELNDGGLLLVGTTVGTVPREGWERKTDYGDSQLRYRSHWTPGCFELALREAGFAVLTRTRHLDPFGKTWMDYVARRERYQRFPLAREAALARAIGRHEGAVERGIPRA
jgi:hypothetical protein